MSESINRTINPLDKSARVASVSDPFNVVINRGAAHGVAVGDRYLIFSIGQEVFDPETRESLGKLEVVKGIGAVTHVQERMATLSSTKKKPPSSSVKTVTRNSGALVGLLGGSTVEERTGETIPVPFSDPDIGDQARPI